jgi:hypothetical protein
MLPLCTLIPVPLLVAGRRYLRRSLAGTPRVAAWTAVASAGIAVEVLFWLWLGFSHVGRFPLLPDPSWHALDFSVGFLIVGAAMAGVLLGVPSPGTLGHGPATETAFAVSAVAVPCLLAFVLLVAFYGPTYGPGSGTLTGIVAKCTPAELGGVPEDPSPVVTVFVQNLVGQTVASQSLPMRTSGARYRMRLLAGTYMVNISTGWGYSDGYTVTVAANQTPEGDFNDSGCVG